jgi:hypothetical protein
MTRTAACSCGQLTVEVTGEPDFVAACNCLECQKSTGSVFGVSTYWPKSAVVAISGASACWRRSSWKGRWLDNYFCPVCGSTIYWYAEMSPGSIGISAGNFADPAFPAPQHAVWCESKHPWVKFPAGCQEHPRQPDR